MKFKLKTQHKHMLLMVVACVVALVSFFNPRERPNFTDFQVYWDASLKALSHHTVYDVVGHYQYKYSPLIALLFGVFTKITASNLQIGQWVFYALSCALWTLWAAYLMRSPKFNKTSKLLMSAIFVLAFFVSLRNDLKLGQMNHIALLIFTAAIFEAYKSARGSLLAGLFLCLAIQIKLWAGVGIFAYVIWKKWRSLAGLALGFGVSYLALGAFHGFSFTHAELASWLQSLMASSEELMRSYYNISLPGSLLVWGLSVQLTKLVSVALLAGFLYFLWKLSKLKIQAVEVLAVLLAFVVIFNPLVWPYWILLLAPALFILLERKEYYVVAAFVVISRLQQSPSMLEYKILTLFCLGIFILSCKQLATRRR